MEIVRKKEFEVIVFKLENKTFIVHIVFLISSNIHLLYKTQIVLLKIYNTFTIILPKYTSFVNIVSSNLVVKFFKYTRISNYIIDLIDNKKQLYKPIYSLGLVKLEILKIYIETNLANSFIRSSKSFTNALNFFV